MSIGSLTQEDPIGLAGGLNLYGFAGGDPVNFSDPFGLFECLVRGNCTQSDVLSTPVTVTLANNQTWENVDPSVSSEITIAARTAGITTVGVSWTTGGDHDPGSRHYPENNGGVGKAADIYSLDGHVMTSNDRSPVIDKFQERLDKMPHARENFGPALIHKSGQPFCTNGSDACGALIRKHQVTSPHVHYSVN